ncbi:MAG: site-specific DNA-methyltransferase [Candidatus Cloacimonadota bacterium]|nr:site-specific DNA-methyltransferase [Candidatus Cloacimonadota bacterium]
MKINEIFLGDFFKLIKEIEDESIDLIVCDGPYGVTEKKWDKPRKIYIQRGKVKNIQEFNLQLIKILSKKLKTGGSFYLFGKPDCIDFIDYKPYLTLNSKIVWYQPSRLAQGRISYTNNYDIIAYFTKGKAKTFNLNEIRVPQLVELTHRKRCENVPSVVNGEFGKTKFNERGKNPGDVWGDIKQLTYKSKELLSREYLHTIQKPKKLIERIVKASSNEGDLVLDPFAGTGTTLVVCQEIKRNYIGFEINPNLFSICKKRISEIKSEQEGMLYSTSRHVAFTEKEIIAKNLGE